ncbi:hypothetical protein ACVINH_004467 [Rhizobium anhuiense]
MLRGCTSTPIPARAAAVNPLRLPQVQTIRHGTPFRPSASRAITRVTLGGGKAIRGRGPEASTRSGSRASQTSGSR